MDMSQVLAIALAVAGGIDAHARGPGSPRGQPGGDVQITADASDPAVVTGLSSERVAAQARYLFAALDVDHSGELMPRDVPATLALGARFLEFDFDGDGRIGVAEFEAWFATQHYVQRGDRWFPRIASTPLDGDPLGATDADDNAPVDEQD